MWHQEEKEQTILYNLYTVGNHTQIFFLFFFCFYVEGNRPEEDFQAHRPSPLTNVILYEHDQQAPSHMCNLSSFSFYKSRPASVLNNQRLLRPPSLGDLTTLSSHRYAPGMHFFAWHVKTIVMSRAS